MSDSELESFKRNVNLIAFAETFGFVVDKKKSWRGSTFMRNGSELIIVSSKDGRAVYWSPSEKNNAGSIIDFALRHGFDNLGEVRKELRLWL